MKVLILSITAGEGHNSTANAIKQCFESHGDTAEVFDAYAYVSKALYGLIKHGYLLVTKDLKSLYSMSYSKLEKRKLAKNTMFRTANTLVTKKLKKLMHEFQPDAVIYTHSFLGVVTDMLKTERGVDVPMIGVVTDYTVHPYWEEARSIDKIVVGSHLLSSQLFRKGFSKEKIAPIGIPVRKQFFESKSKEQARKELGIENKFTALLMAGSMGYGNIANVVKELDEIDADFQIISVCGNNKSAKESVDKLGAKKNVLNFGFTKEVSLLMDAADVIITKPGGLTVSESLVKNLPMILCNPIPGQEDRNATFLVNSGVAMAVDKHTPLADVFYQLLNNPVRIETMLKSIEHVSPKRSTEDLYDLTKELVLNYDD